MSHLKKICFKSVFLGYMNVKGACRRYGNVIFECSETNFKKLNEHSNKTFPQTVQEQ